MLILACSLSTILTLRRVTATTSKPFSNRALTVSPPVYPEAPKTTALFGIALALVGFVKIVNAVYEAGGANLMKFRLLTSFENLDFNLVISGVYLSILL